jgi:hypothetical protein
LQCGKAITFDTSHLYLTFKAAFAISSSLGGGGGRKGGVLFASFTLKNIMVAEDLFVFFVFVL